MQNRGQLFWGVALITSGLLFFGQRMGWVTFDWEILRNLWPLLLILAGVNLILQRQGQQAAVVTTVLLGLAVPLIVFGYVGHRRNWRNTHRFDFRDNRNNNDTENNGDDEDSDNSDSDNGDDNESDYNSEKTDRNNTENMTAFVEAMNPATRTATLNLTGGAGKFTIGEPVSELIKADAKTSVGSYKMSVERDDATKAATINLSPSDGDKDSDGDMNINLGEGKNQVDVRLSDKPIWTVNATVGAGKGSFDLSRYVVSNLKLEAGAADVELTLGSKATQSDIKISSGVAAIVVRVPKGVGVKVKREGALNVNTLDGFTDAGNNTAISPDYEKTANKINIDFEGGISSFKVVRY
jgi:Domain of unknown function (DUF5668)